MTASKQHSCPNCEYEKSTPGTPVVEGETITCMDCGTSWKEFSGTTLNRIETPTKSVMEELRELARNSDTISFDEPETQTSMRGNLNSVLPSANGLGIAPYAMAIFLIAAVVGGATWFLNLNEQPQIAIQQGPISISEVKLKEQVGRDGRKVITVRGLIVNATSTPERVPPIAIVLRKKDGGEIVRWQYKSPKPILKPGVKTRFASSIQYDTPVIAYAEAIIQ